VEICETMPHLANGAVRNALCKAMINKIGRRSKKVEEYQNSEQVIFKKIQKLSVISKFWTVFFYFLDGQ